MTVRDFDARKPEDRKRVQAMIDEQRAAAAYDWTCGHKAGAMCQECHRQLALISHELAEENMRLKDENAALKSQLELCQAAQP